MKNFKKLPIWLQWFWKIWLGSIAGLFLIRFAFLHRANENTRFFVFVPFVLIPWLAIIGINMYLVARLKSYLRKNHSAQRHIWGSFGPLAIVRMKFLFSQQDLGDEVLRWLKREYVAFLKLALVEFLATPFLFIAVMLGAKLS